MSVGSSPDLYNILNTILQDTAPHSMSELYNISFSDGTSTVSSGTISLSSFINKIIGTGMYSYSSGFEWGYYDDNYHDGGYSGNQTWFDTRTPVYTHNSPGRSRVTDFTNISTASSGQTSVNGDETYSYLWTGYFKAPITSTYYFKTRSDDNSHMWVGTSALNPSYSNETVDNGGLHGMQTVTSAGVSLTGGVYYDFRMTFGEQGGGDDLQAQWRNNSTSFSYDWSTVAFSNRQVSTIIAFHYGTFSSSDYSGLYSTVSAAANAGYVYSNTPSGTYTWGTLGTPSTVSNQTTYTWTPSSSITGADVLMVAGGGGGGGSVGAGGGGAGGALYYTNQSLSGQKTIVVGNGGVGGVGFGQQVENDGGDGYDTTFTGLTTVIGGGGGGSNTNITDPTTTRDGHTGGSGGGGGYGTFDPADYGTDGLGGTGTSGQGNDGGIAFGGEAGGGGGGAGSAGSNATDGAGANGGTGIDKSSVFGTTYGDLGWFASGGGGGGRSGRATAGTASQGGGSSGEVDNTKADDAQLHTGGGGGGGGYSSSNSNQQGGNGGSGIVLIKY